MIDSNLVEVFEVDIYSCACADCGSDSKHVGEEMHQQTETSIQHEAEHDETAHPETRNLQHQQHSESATQALGCDTVQVKVDDWRRLKTEGTIRVNQRVAEQSGETEELIENPEAS